MVEFDAHSYVLKTVRSWTNITVQPYRFGGMEILFGIREIGHIQSSGLMDVSLGREIAQQVISEGRAQSYPLQPNSSWITFGINSRGDVHRALWLLRLGYLLKQIRWHTQSNTLYGDVQAEIRQELCTLRVSPALNYQFEYLLSGT